MNTKPHPSIAYALWLLFLLALHSNSFGQHTQKVIFDEHRNKSARPYTITTHYPTTGIAVAIAPNDSFTGSWIAADNDTLWLKADPHSDESSNLQYSNLLTIHHAVDEFTFYPGSIQGDITFTYIDARLPENAMPLRSAKKKSAGCSEPEIISQTEWRTGLPDPEYERVPNPVYNLIIHHSAGSNTDTNYVQVVRNIYLYHTEVRGWSDIGYNYLIAQNGLIFAGRDPDTLQQDSVMGAHFCASNSGTLGTCILGDYTNRIPTDTTLSSLVHLLNWQAGKQGLDPLAQHAHPLNAALPVIAGHRDGCATECPGNKLYELLENLRQASNQAFANCLFEVNPLEPTPTIQDHPLITVQYGKIHISNPTPTEARFFTLMGTPLEAKKTISSETESVYQLSIRTWGLIGVYLHHAGGGSVARLIYLPQEFVSE